MSALVLTAGWIAVLFVGLLGLILLWKIYKNEIDLRLLISESTGEASLSRFQFLIFTFVIALSFFLVTASAQQLAEVPDGVWALLGISGGSYVISKGIQKSAGAGKGETRGQGSAENKG